MTSMKRLVADADSGGLRYSAETFVPHEMIKWTSKPLEVDREFWPNVKKVLLQKLSKAYGHDNYRVIRFRAVADNFGIMAAEEVKWK